MGSARPLLGLEFKVLALVILLVALVRLLRRAGTPAVGRAEVLTDRTGSVSGALAVGAGASRLSGRRSRGRW